MKFGGTSVEDAVAIRRLIEIVRRERNRQPLVVVSACAGVTNELLRSAQTVRGGKLRPSAPSGQHRHRAARAGAGCAGAAAQLLSRRLGHRRAQTARDGNH